jgi:PAS domain S-box-containing protein
MFGAMAEGVVFQSAEGAIEACNASAERILGLTAEQMAGRTSMDLRWRAIHEDGSPFPGETHPAMVTLRTGEPQTGVIMGVHKPDGTLSWIAINSRAIIRDGKRQGVVATFIDVTAHKIAEDALRDSELRFRAVVEQAQVGVALAGAATGRFRVINPKFCEILGATAAELIGTDFRRFSHPDDLAGDQEAMRQVRSGEVAIVRREKRYVRPDGTVRWANVRVSRLRAGEADSDLVVTAEDITERKEHEERFAKFFHANPVPLTVTDPERGGIVIEVNDAFTRVTGFSREESIGRTAADLGAWADLAEREPVMRQLAATGMVRGVECRLKRKSGEHYTALVSGQIVELNGKRCVIGSILDISAQKQAQEDREKLQAQLAQSQKMESVGLLAGGVAHDFNNLLTVINGYSMMALAKLGPQDPIRDLVSEIQRAGERAAGLTSQLLAFSRKQVLQPRVLDLNRVVADMRPMLERLMGEDVEVRLKASRKAARVQADPHQLEQVIMNLAVNAREAMQRGGRFLIDISIGDRDEGPEAPAGRYAALAVSDNGRGMDEATRQRIFEPFFTTKATGKGTGLGLSMVQGIVAQSGGFISVTSVPDRGTTFRIYLPAATDAAVEAPATAAAADSTTGGTETILLAEDQEEVREYAATVLAGYGYHVIASANAAEALALMEQESSRIHLLLTDVVMPQTSGKELASRVSALRPGIKVLFMSGYTGDVIVHHGVLSDGTEFIAKPFTPEELARKVRAALGPSVPPARIVVADDEAPVRAFVRALLEQSGHQVVEAADGREALRQAHEGQVDLLITDLVMPEQEGVETIQLLRRDAPGVGIIAMSGAFGGQFLNLAHALGAHAVLKKPIRPEALLAKVAEVLTRER